MSPPDAKQNRVFLLTVARLFGVTFSFVIPMYLGRILPVETYGIYKQVLLIFWFCQVGLNLGLDDSVYYFFRKDSRSLSLLSFNALAFNLIVTILIGLVMIFFKSNIADSLNNPALAEYIPYLAFLIVLTVCSLQIEGLLLNLDKILHRVLLDASTEALKAGAILASFYFFGSLKLAILGITCIMLARLFWVIGIIYLHRTKETYRLKNFFQNFLSQIRFGLPLGISRLIQHLLSLEHFFVSSFYSLVDFTFYSVGCFENPLINSARASLNEVLNVEMADAVQKQKKDLAVHIWKSMNRKLFLLIIPFAMFLICFSEEVIVFIFSEKFLASAPYFGLFNIYILAASINAEPIFRACARTRLALWIKLTGVILSLALIFSIGKLGGAISILYIKIGSTLVINLTGAYVGARLLSVKFLDLFSWGDFFKIGLVSFFVAYGLSHSSLIVKLPLFWFLGANFIFYVFLVSSISVKLGILKNEDYQYLKLRLRKTLFFLKGR